MAKRQSRSRSLLAAVLLAGFPSAAFAQVPVSPYAVFLDGNPDGTVRAYYNGAHTMVSLENIGKRLRLRVTKSGSTRLLHIGPDAYAFAPAQTSVTLNGETVMQTVGPPEERNAMLFVTVDDLEALLSQSFAVGTSRITITTASAAQNVHTAPLTHPRVSQYTVRTDSGSGGGGAAPQQRPRAAADPSNALVIHAELADSNGFRSRDLSFTTDGTRLRGSLDVSAFDTSPAGVAGGIAIGTHDHYVQFGSQSNPLNGLMFNAPGGYGIGTHEAQNAISIERDSLGRTVMLARHDRDNGATFYGAIRAAGEITPLVGERQSQDGVLKITREFWLSSRGAAASIGLATQGRFFGEAVFSESIGNFPLTAGEAPERLDAGLRIGDRMTFRAGVSSGHSIKASPYVGISFFGVSGMNGSLQITGAGRNATVSYAGPHGSIAGTLTTSPEGSSWGISGSFAQRNRVLDISAFRSGNSEDDILRSHSTGGIGLITGIERLVSAGKQRIGPIVGLNIPIGRTTAFEITEHPIAGGRALGFGLTQRIGFSPRIHLRSIQLQNAGPGNLYIDDRLVQRVGADTARTAVAAGSHRIQLRSIDGTQASLTQTIDDASTHVDVALLPVRPIAGRIVQSDADPAGRKVSLAHLQVRLEPGDLIVETEADGSFVIPPSPVAQGARVSIVRESLPDELAPGDDAPADAPALHLDVRTKIKVRHKKF